MALDTTGEKGDLSTVTSSIPGFTSLQGQVDYGYDHKRQLTLEDSDRHGGYSDANSFDGAGNATTFRNNARTYNADNQLTGPGTYVYDGNGNPTTWSGTSLTFDVENRMTAYGTSLTAGYRGDGLRAWKNTASGQTYFLYDGISVVCELDAGGSVNAGSTYGAAGLLSRGSVQYQFDHLGDATIRLDGSGNVLSYRLFDAWGNELSSGSEPYGYRARYGYYTDTGTGLIALAFRYYAPEMGRFVEREPVLDASSALLYGFDRGNPLAYLDIDGAQAETWPPGRPTLPIEPDVPTAPVVPEAPVVPIRPIWQPAIGWWSQVVVPVITVLLCAAPANAPGAFPQPMGQMEGEKGRRRNCICWVKCVIRTQTTGREGFVYGQGQGPDGGTACAQANRSARNKAVEVYGDGHIWGHCHTVHGYPKCWHM